MTTPDTTFKSSRPLQCTVYFLDDSFETFDLERREKAQVLLNRVFDHLDISEKKYFGLQFYDTMSSEENLSGCDHTELIRWVDPLKSIKKQLKTLPPYSFYFRVKFYVPEPDLLEEEYTRFYYFLQLNKDLSTNKLKVSPQQLIHLAAYSAQSELGDYSATEHHNNTAYHFDYLKNKSSECFEDVRTLHQKLKGTRPIECEMRFLKLVKQIDTYGINLYKATMEQSCREIHIGVTARGLLVFKQNSNTNTFKWADIIKLSFKRKLFFIHLHKPASQLEGSFENIYGFHMSCYRSCKNLWKACVEHHTFFCLHSQQQQKQQNKQQLPQAKDKQQHHLKDKDNDRDTSKDSTQQQQKSYNSQQQQLDCLGSESNKNISKNSNNNNNKINNINQSASSLMYQGKSKSGVVRSISSKSPSSSPPIDFSDNTALSLSFLPITNNRQVNSSSTHSSTNPPSTHLSSHQTPAPANRSIPNPAPSSSTTHYMFDLPTTPQQPQPSPTITITQKSLDHTFKPTTTTTTQRNLNRSTAFRSTHAAEPLNNPSSQPSSFKSGFIIQDNNSTDNNIDISIYDNDNLDMEIPHTSFTNNNNTNNNNNNNNNNNKNLSDRKRIFESKPVIAQAESSEDEDGRVVDKPDAKTITTLSPIVMVTNNNNNNNNPFNNDNNKNVFSPESEVRQSCDNKNKSTQPTCLPAQLITHSPTSPSNHSRDGKVRGGVAGVAFDGLITVRMRPDDQGRFGFNVKGGSDLEQAIVVSRVAPGSPADSCTPNLSEGDHVLFINGRDVSQHTHAQVVQFIRASREIHSGELVLVIQRNAYLNDVSPGEPDFQYIPDSHHMVAVLPPKADHLAASIYLLRESLESGSGLAQFDQLYRKKAGMSMTSSQMPHNLSKNRYRDISPYDTTRVKLKDYASDYINASYVNMTIPGSNLTNHYIATQGPLPNTTRDFWNMVVQEESSLIIMLTVTVERGRTKCHKYWPDLDTCLLFKENAKKDAVNDKKNINLDLNAYSTPKNNKNVKSNRNLCVTNVSETQPCDSYVCREFLLSYEDCDDDDADDDVCGGGDDDDEDGVLKAARLSRLHSSSTSPTVLNKIPKMVRRVRQLQYTAWPDHGVPDDCSDFLDFIDLVKRLKDAGGGVVGGSGGGGGSSSGGGGVVGGGGEEKPCIVHCSAGIGRTGVLIAMETARALIEAHHPIHLLDVVRQMREQRGMLIQTPSQYKFVCEAILKVYDEKLVVPLNQYKRL